MSDEFPNKRILNLLRPIAKNTLGVFSTVSSAAKAHLKDKGLGAGAFAFVNTMTDVGEMKAIENIADTRWRDLQRLTGEPAIARIVARSDDGKEATYYICRATPDPVKVSEEGAFLASYRAPLGRIASTPVGSEFEFERPDGVAYLEILESAKLHPEQIEGEWDSINSELEGPGYGTITVGSFLELLRERVVDEDLLGDLLAEAEAESNIKEGKRRGPITKMALRDQPILDQYQDSIFRLPLDNQLLILGPPGSGKTTTLIKRLSQKLDRNFLDEDEKKIVDQGKISQAPDHEHSWIMFTPTELLKQYLKEAFAREGIAASDERVTSWDSYRRQLARTTFRVLKTAAGGGPLILKGNLDSLLESTISKSTDWFDDFQPWQAAAFWDDLKKDARALDEDPEEAVSRLGSRLCASLEKAGPGSLASTFISLATFRDEIRELVSDEKEETDGKIRKALNLRVNQNRKFLDELATFIEGLKDIDDDPDDQEVEDEDEAGQPKSGLGVAMTAYFNAIRSQARVLVTKRKLGRKSRSGQIAEWIAETSLSPDELREIGESLLVQSRARKFLNPLRRYFNGIPQRYRGFRSVRRSENRWYTADDYKSSEVGPLEVDLILLCILRGAEELLRNRQILADIDSGSYGMLQQFRALNMNQVMVDEATDFSPIQLACMAAISNSNIRSFFACGDFNQRITDWGSRSKSDVSWALPDIRFELIEISYRHSAQLSELANELVRLSGGETLDVKLPDNMNNEGVPPVLSKGLEGLNPVAAWLAERIVEIEKRTGILPSVAILVNYDEEVGPMADALNDALEEKNMKVVACHDGQAVGLQTDIRVFNNEYIKGLEFEAVFFVGIDQLAENKPSLFDKYLYVGITRAATYLGLTCAGAQFPSMIQELESRFQQNWAI